MHIFKNIRSPFAFRRSSGSLGLTMANNHYNRITALGGVLPCGIINLAAALDLIIACYSITDEADFNVKVPVFVDPHYTGYYLGSGSGITTGNGARYLYGINPTSDMSQATAASQPLLLTHSGVNYWFGPNSTDNYCKTPNAAANRVTGDIDIKAKINVYSLSGDSCICNKAFYAGGNFGYNFRLNGSTLIFMYHPTGDTAGRIVKSSTANLASAGYTIGSDIWVRIFRDSVTGDVKFYYSFSATSDPTLVAWTQLGATVASSASALYGSSEDLEIGIWGNLLYTFQGKIYRVTIATSFNGAAVVDFNPGSFNMSVSHTQWNSVSGETWTVYTATASSGYKGVIANRTLMLFDRVDDLMTSSGVFSFEADGAIYTASRQFATSQTNIVLSYGASGNDYFSVYQDATGRHNVEYYLNPTQKITRFTGQNTLLSFNSDLLNSNVLTEYLNNVLQVTGSNAAVPNITNSVITIGRLTSTSFYGNIYLSTLLISSVANDSTKATSMYNLIRGMNNNAF